MPEPQCRCPYCESTDLMPLNAGVDLNEIVARKIMQGKHMDYSRNIGAAREVHRLALTWPLAQRDKYLKALVGVVQNRIGPSVGLQTASLLAAPEEFCIAALLALS